MFGPVQLKLTIMGLFDSFKSSNQNVQPSQNFICPNEQSAWLGILTASASVNHEISPAENDKLSRTWIWKTFFDGYDMMYYYKPLLIYCNTYGSKMLIDSCISYISEENKATVLCSVMDLISSDGVIDGDEKEIFEYIATSLKVPEETSLKIIEVFAMHNKWNKLLLT